MSENVSEEKIMRNELDSVAFAISPEIAAELGEALMERAAELIERTLPETRQ